MIYPRSEHFSDSVDPGREYAQAAMDYLETCDYRGQWDGYDILKENARGNPGLTVGLVEYAADETSTDSLLFRSFALEAGLRSIRAAVMTGSRQLTDEEQAIYERTQELIPEYFQDGIIGLFEGGEMSLGKPALNWFFGQRAKEDGLSPNLIVYDHTRLGYDPTTLTDNAPIVAGLLLRRMMRTGNDYDIASLSPTVGKDALRTALDFRSEAYAAAIADNPSRIGEFARLARFTTCGGFEHDAPMEYLYNLPGERGERYANTLNSLYDSLANLRDVFPEDSTQGVVLGARFLAANATFAVAEHLRTGEMTDSSLSLLGGSDLPVEYKGSEPLALLQMFDSKLRRAHGIVTDPDTKVELGVDEPDFSIYDFKHQLDDPMRVMKYIRPEGGYTCNYRYEYGGRRWGVLASNDLRIDDGPLLDPTRPYHKKSLSSQGISIRLDREGRSPEAAVAMAEQDPTIEVGTISLDVGSIMGDGFGARIGRLLAWGNMLRSRHVKVPQVLNHATGAFDQSLGTRLGFREMALADSRMLESRRAADEHYHPALVLAGLAVRAS